MDLTSPDKEETTPHAPLGKESDELIHWYASLDMKGSDQPEEEREMLAKTCLVLHMIAANDPPMLPIVKHINYTDNTMLIGKVTSRTTGKVYEYKAIVKKVMPADIPEGIPIDTAFNHLAVERFIATYNGVTIVEFSTEDLMQAMGQYRESIMANMVSDLREKLAFEQSLPGEDKIVWN